MYLLFSYRSVLDVVTDTTLVTEHYYLRSPVIEELLVLRISSNFGAVIHPTKYNPVDEAHFLQQHLQVLYDDVGCRKRLNAYPCFASGVV